MKYDFDKIVVRKNTDCFKWDFAERIFKNTDALPMWVADMDFEAPPEVVSAIKKRAEHGVYGYALTPESYYESFISWIKKRHGFELKRDWLLFSPGIVPALSMSVMAYTAPGDKILIQTPVYNPFFTVVKDNGREVIENTLVLENGKYVIDFDDFENKIKTGVKMFILCNPHNPVGRVWQREELRKMAEICLKYKVIIVSDEIHSDVIYSGHKHVSIASLSDETLQNTVTLMAPSKTFNITGLAISSAVIANPALYAKFKKISESLHISNPAVFGVTAFEAAYRHGEKWLGELLKYLESNRDFMNDFIKSNLPQVKMVVPEGTFLAWLDFRRLKLSQKELNDLMVFKARLGLNDGEGFGASGRGFMRINFGCPRATLSEGLNRLETAFKIV